MLFTGEIIRSRQNKNIVELCKLTDRKAREVTKTFRFDGIKLLEEAIKNDVEICAVFLSSVAKEKVFDFLCSRFGNMYEDKIEKCFVVSDDIFDKISEEKSPEGVITIAKYIDKLQKNATIYNSVHFLQAKNESIVLLESVRDPSNVGAIIR